MKARFLSSAAFAAACLVAGPALAQDAATDDSQLQDIVVTAQKRSESAQDIPVVVTAVSGDVLARSGVKDLVQAATLIPGIVFSRAPDDGLAMTFRGLGTVARSQAFELSEALFIDGVFMGKGRMYTTSFFDVDRMEFIKGTQSTLLGKNASLGAISVVTKQPGDTMSIEARAGYEVERGGYTLDAAATAPLASNVSLRIAGHYNNLQGWVRNDVTRNWGRQQKDLGLRGTLRADLTDALHLTASYQYADNRQIGASYQLVVDDPVVRAAFPTDIFGDAKLDRHTSQFTTGTGNGDTFHGNKSHIASLKGELEIGDHTLVSQTAYLRYKTHYLDDFDFSPTDEVNFQRDERYHQFTQELRIQSPTGNAFEYMAGVYFLSARWHSIEDQQWAAQGIPPQIDGVWQLFNGGFTNDFIQKSKTYSAFASGAYHITEGLRLAGGVRWTRETKDILSGRTPDAGPLTIWNTIANPPFDPTPLSHKSNFFDGNVSLQYDFTRDVMGFVAFGHGSKSGGFVETNTIAVPPFLLVDGKVPAALVAAGSAIKDEYTRTWEAGFKTTLLDRRLRFNITGFYTKVKNFQDTVFTGGPLGFITFNGPAKTKGVEIETAFQISHQFRLDGGFTYADATGEIQPIDPATSAPAVDGSGNPILGWYRRSQAPKIVFNAGANFNTPITNSLNLELGANVRHRSSMYNQRQELFPSEKLTTLNLSAGISAADDTWGIEIAARNVTNELVQDFASPSVDPVPGVFGAYLAGASDHGERTRQVLTRDRPDNEELVRPDG